MVVLNAGVRKKPREMTFLSLEEVELAEDEEVIFCGMNCYVQFAITRTSAAREAKVNGL